ncbi:indole-3-glycerol-phosphate synthase [Candidatus Gottesmanbacteria bacterium]|nr:indole-3-glycerol-phosphate synthase [Candidatus Gottesmanbacteria bacterium]
MKNKLTQILDNKMKEVSQKKKKRDFLGAITNPKMGDISIIAEIKLASPTAGKLGEEKDIEKQVLMYEKSYADGISVVVDKKYFDGELEFIKQIKNTVSLPLLAKDFIIDPYQIYEAKLYGADAILLIAKILTKKKLQKFVKHCFDAGLEPVVEVQNKKELEKVLNIGTRIIAVNARGLSTFKVDVDGACQLIKSIPKEFVSLGFSGVLGINEVEQYKKAGAKGILVGITLMKSKNPGKVIKEFKGL